MSLLTLPRASIPVIDANGYMNREWYRWASDATARMGGVEGTGTDDLSLSQFEDAGIEEAKQGIYRLVDEIGQLPPIVVEQIEALETETAQLREAVAALMRMVQDMQEGINL